MDTSALGKEPVVEEATFWDEPGTCVGVDNRRRHLRIPGPFDGMRVGFLPTPLQIFDLSLGGCFVNSLHDQQEGVVFNLRIDLPQEGWIALKAETLYRRDGGYAVRFLGMTDVTRKRLERALENWRDRY
jgi:hypothetical protein